jgi:hypothetical protein
MFCVSELMDEVSSALFGGINACVSSMISSCGLPAVPVDEPCDIYLLPIRDAQCVACHVPHQHRGIKVPTYCCAMGGFLLCGVKFVSEGHYFHLEQGWANSDPLRVFFCGPPRQSEKSALNI